MARASAIALRWGVHPHEVLIANGWLAADDYYRALAEICGAPFKAERQTSGARMKRARRARSLSKPLARHWRVEDRPERDQFRRALHAFRDGPPNLATVQAKLNLYNASDNWLTRQFTIEYCALFDALLPALDRLKLPIPLGGTSNHFRASALKWLMAWDPFNVTEDADLGMRLARSGYRCQVLQSTTYEGAPRRFMSWLRQRTRWLKGYVQTWLVHLRSPRTLWRELGPVGFFAFQITVGGTVLSALVHPGSCASRLRARTRRPARTVGKADSPDQMARPRDSLYRALKGACRSEMPCRIRIARRCSLPTAS
ncbi:MAG TPA: glycosyltransferase family 2 protein [Methyloceanibacter sp.]|nr:glycosyltransferase family 2 protein [Methyloceanibacter sp.]